MNSTHLTYFSSWKQCKSLIWDYKSNQPNDYEVGNFLESFQTLTAMKLQKISRWATGQRCQEAQVTSLPLLPVLIMEEVQETPTVCGKVLCEVAGHKTAQQEAGGHEGMRT